MQILKRFDNFYSTNAKEISLRGNSLVGYSDTPITFAEIFGNISSAKKWFKEKTNKKGSIHHRKVSSYQMETKFRFLIKKKKKDNKTK